MNLPEYCIVCGAMNGWIHPRDADRHCPFNVCEFKELLPPWHPGPVTNILNNYSYATFATTTSADYVIHNYNSSTTTETE